MSFSITYTIKNEARMLPEAIRYHRALGCSRFYVFYDGTTDETPALLSAMPDVVARPNVRPEEVEDTTDWFTWVRDNWDDWMDLRKMLNIYWAACQARADGITWISALDPDELIVGGMADRFSPGSLEALLAGVSEQADQVKMINLDAVPATETSSHPFGPHDLFLGRFPVAEQLWRYSRFVVRKLLRSPVAEAWYDQLYFQALLRRGFPRVMRHPVTRRVIPTGYFLSYFNGKSFVRTSRIAKMRPLIHYWKPLPGQSVKTVHAGMVLHYDLIDANQFMHKFRQRPDTTFVRGLYTRWMIGTMARDLPEDKVHEFFRDSVVISSPQRQKELISRGVLHRIGSVADFFGRAPD